MNLTSGVSSTAGRRELLLKQHGSLPGNARCAHDCLRVKSQAGRHGSTCRGDPGTCADLAGPESSCRRRVSGPLYFAFAGLLSTQPAPSVTVSQAGVPVRQSAAGTSGVSATPKSKLFGPAGSRRRSRSGLAGLGRGGRMLIDRNRPEILTASPRAGAINTVLP